MNSSFKSADFELTNRMLHLCHQIYSMTADFFFLLLSALEEIRKKNIQFFCNQLEFSLFFMSKKFHAVQCFHIVIDCLSTATTHNLCKEKIKFWNVISRETFQMYFQFLSPRIEFISFSGAFEQSTFWRKINNW